MIAKLPISVALKKEADCLQSVANNPEHSHLWFWHTDQCLVVPRSFKSHPNFAKAAEELNACGWPIKLRTTGGDITPQGRNIINVSLIYATDRKSKIHQTYNTLCDPIETTLRYFGVEASRGSLNGAFCDGAHNIQVLAKKFAGTAQHRTRCKSTSNKIAILAHAVMLMASPKDEVFEAINLLLDLLGRPKEIIAERHVDLSEKINPTEFISYLKEQYQRCEAYDDREGVSE